MDFTLVISVIFFFFFFDKYVRGDVIRVIILEVRERNSKSFESGISLVNFLIVLVNYFSNRNKMPY